jgi:guanylate kinase
MVHYESIPGEAFFEIHPGYVYLKPQMLDYAEKHLRGKTPEGREYIKAFINDFDKDFETLAKSRGYEKNDKFARPMSQLTMTVPFPRIFVPEGLL